ncbi:integrator complex subunit 3-like [Hydractinia symbiolongicarpus]|uniref:integrator complex subunit 3-like n=1 Tax=Hydractinia symbiolongicarpus TaxID=13093 RepID=UPI00254D14EF|nr:integrator complex subunit 3-like [Hydractinia symbiolongicarpus]
MDSVEAQKLWKPKLFSCTVLQPKDELEDRLDKCHVVVINLVSGSSERENHDALNQAVCKGMKEHEEISLGLLYTILTEQENAPKAYRDLSFVSRDGLALVGNKVQQILTEKFQRLLDSPKAQCLWLIGEMMKNQVQNLEMTIHILLRQIAGGDHSPANIWLVENVLKLMKANRPWLEKNPGSLQLVIYTYLRIIEDHEGPRFKVLRQSEVDFCVTLIRDRFGDCLQIGRDFVRLLQNVFRIPEFTKLWKDMLFRPKSLSSQFTGLPQLLNTRTSRKFLASRMTIDMENKLAFLALKVKFGLQKRYQDWFFRQYLSNAESQTLLPDIVRFICGVIHPPNEILASDVIPRWAILGWLYTACQNPVTQTNMKLALFFDWLFFQGEKDNIMNIEPAMLLMHNSVRTHPNITYSLLDFICRMSKHYSLQFSNLTKQGLFNSFKSILDKRVVSSLSPVLKSSRMDKELKMLISETLPSFVVVDRSATSTSDESSSTTPPQSPTIDPSKDFSLNLNEQASGGLSIVEIADESSTDEAVFSDEDDDDKAAPPPPPPPPDKKEKVASIQSSSTSNSSFRPIAIKEEDFETKVDEGFVGDDVTELEEFQNLDSNLLKDNLLKLKNEKEESSKAEAMEAIISNIESMGDFDDEIASPLCVCLANCLADDLALPVLPDSITEKTIEGSLERPQYAIFRAICSLSKNDVNRENLYVLLNGIHEIDEKIGYHFLYFLKACYNDPEKFSVYEDYVSYFKDRTLKTVLTQDMKACYEYDPALFMYLIEMIFKHFHEVAVGNKEIIKMLVATVHPNEMNAILSGILLEDLSIIGENQVGGLLEASLEWTAFEQSCLWQLINAEETPIEMLIGILPELKAKKHAESLNQLLLQLRAESPQMEIIKPVLCMDVEGSGKNFSLCLFKTWCHSEARELAHVLAQLLTKPNPTVKKRQGNSSTRHNPTLNQIVLHLNQFYKHLQSSEKDSKSKDMSLFKYESLRYALTQAKKNVTDQDIKTKCKPLFAEFTELPTRSNRKRKNQRVTRSRRGGRVRKEESSEESESDDEDEDEESDEDSEEEEEEEVVETKTKGRPPSKKRRKASKNLSSDEED